MFYIYIYIYRMDKQDLLDNLSGQKYVDGYVVNEEKPQFAKIRDKILLGTKFTKGQGNIKDNEVFVQRPTVKEDKTTRKIYVQTSDFEDFEEHKQFQKARRVDLQIQNRLNERLVNQIETSYAPQATTLAELKALQTTRPQLQKELEAVEEYAKTHYLTKEQKAKLKEDVYKKNYKKWKSGIESVQTGEANENAEDLNEQRPFPRDPRLPPIQPSDTTKSRKQDIEKYGDYIDLEATLGETQIREMASQILNPNVDFMQSFKPDKTKYYAFQQFLQLLINKKPKLQRRIILQLRKGDNMPKYIINIFQIINRVYNRLYKNPFIKQPFNNLKNLSSQSLQFNKMMDVFYNVFQDIRIQIPRKVNDKLLIKTSNIDEERQQSGKTINLIVGDLYIDTFSEYKEYINRNKGRAQPVIEIDAGNAGGAAGGGN